MAGLLNRKTIDRLGSSLNDYSGMGVSAFAKKQMEKLGWQEGKGLGAEEDGIVDAIKLKRRVQGEGIGEDTRRVEEVNDEWWRSAFDKGAGKMLKKDGKKVPIPVSILIPHAAHTCRSIHLHGSTHTHTHT